MDLSSAAQAPLVEALCQRAIKIVGSVVPFGQSIALLDFPRHFNIGDSAIWLGELRCLAACGMRSRDMRYVCDVTTYDEVMLRTAIGADGVILMHGGGNFGDLWDLHQRFRESVVAAFPANQIIVLPQTVHFSNPAALERAQRVFNAHRNITILVRDRPSQEILDESFRAKSQMCPDLAFCLGALPRPSEARQPILYLARTDKESRLAGDYEGTSSARSCDWPAIGSAWQWRLGDVLAHAMSNHPRLLRPLRAPTMPLARTAYAAMAAERVQRGCELLARGRVVITDRLHAHILSLLLGIPNVVLDNSYGKVRRFHEAWTSSSSLTHFAQTPDEGFAIARELCCNPASESAEPSQDCRDSRVGGYTVADSGNDRGVL